MSYKFSFADNATYNATDINSITKRLVTGGVGDSFQDGVAYNVSKFNEAGKLLYTSGVVPESCQTLKVTKVSDTEILINPGNAFFNDGAVIEIEAGGETLSYISGKKNYVYLKNELVDKNICYPYCGIDEPTGDYVLLAEIDESGKITDRRTYARGRLPGYQSVAGNVMRIQDYIELTDVVGLGQDFEGSKTFDIGNNTYEYILTYTTYSSSYPRTYACLGIYDISKQSYLGFHRTDDFFTSSTASVSSLPIRYFSDSEPGADATFSIDNGKLTVTLSSGSTRESLIGRSYGIDLILF